MYQQHSLEVFQHNFKKDTKAWFSQVRLIYFHSLLHNIISNRTDVTLIFYRTENNFSNFCVTIIKNKKEVFRF